MAVSATAPLPVLPPLLHLILHPRALGGWVGLACTEPVLAACPLHVVQSVVLECVQMEWLSWAGTFIKK